jgi:hypothetical protein
MSVIDLPFVVDNGEEIILIHSFGARISIRWNDQYARSMGNNTGTYEKVVPLFSFSVSFIPSEVKGTMFRDAGKRIVESIFRAEDLSFVLCSNLYKTENHSQFGMRKLRILL